MSAAPTFRTKPLKNWNDVVNFISDLYLAHSQEVVELARVEAVEALKAKDVVAKISHMMSTVTLLAWAVNYYEATRFSYMRKFLPKYPIKVVVKRLPEKLVSHFGEKLVDGIETRCRIAIESISRGGAPANYYHREYVVAALITLNRNADDVDKAVELVYEFMTELKKRGAVVWGVTVDLGVKTDRSEVAILNFDYKNVDFGFVEQFLRKYDFRIRRRTLKEYYIVEGEKWFGNVRVFVNYGTDNFGFVSITICDKIPEIPESIEEPMVIENVAFIPVTDVVAATPPKKLVFERTVQEIGKKLTVYLTQALRAIGVDKGDKVVIEVDTEKRMIVVKPAKQ